MINYKNNGSRGIKPQLNFDYVVQELKEIDFIFPASFTKFLNFDCVNSLNVCKNYFISI